MKPDWEQAARQGDAAALRTQLAGGAPVDALDRYGQSALMLAATAGHHEAVAVLVDAGANLDITAKYHLSATMLAVINGHEMIARLLARSGANLTLTGSGAPGFAGKTAAHLAKDLGLESLAQDLEPGGAG